ncbi:MAG: hypothetical protein KF767_13160 [Bdellovibrionaceae bacterium]|nr:hypothetical protein [Pseudobdellovibrionaceae bacterium]
MRPFLMFVIAFAGLFSQVHASSSVRCENRGPSVDCIEQLFSKTHLSRIEAANLCRGGVSMECVDYLFSKTHLSRIDAVEYCRGGVEVDCIEHLFSKTHLSRLEAAKACGGGN